MRALIISVLSVLGTCGSVSAADLTVIVKTPAGAPVKDAVATLHYASTPSAAPKSAGVYSMTQQDIQFDPFVLIVRVGATVTFPNHDRVRHDVYSFSPTKTFELKLYGREEARTVHMDRAGVIALGCNIHDRMVGFIDVVDTPYVAKTSEAGNAVIQGAPGGTATLTLWRPYMKAPKNEVSRTITLPREGDAQEIVVIDVRPPPGAGMTSMSMR